MEKRTLDIKGMTCSSCEVLIERKLRKVPGIEDVKVDHATGKAVIHCSSEPSLQELQQAVADAGYSLSVSQDQETAPSRNIIYRKKEYLEIGAIFIVLVGLYLLLQRFDLIPSSFTVTDKMSYGVAFGMGLVAAVSSCLAVTGGLLLAVSAKHAEQHPELAGKQKFKPHLSFNAGRILGYTVLGAGVGALGSFFTLSPGLSGILTIFVSIIMILLGIQLLGIFPFLARFQPKMPKFIAHKLYDTSGAQSQAAPFLLGAFTFFLPCGFTQALQLYVLSQGNAVTGAFTMFAFSLGTLPALLSVGAVSSFAKGSFKRYFMKIAGAFVILLGILSISGGFVLTGSAVAFPSSISDSPSAAASPLALADGKQIVQMEVSGLDYYPNSFTIQNGLPVEWQVDGTKARGCARILSAPALGVMQQLRYDAPTIIEFTPAQTGIIRFSCSMGMAGPGEFRVVS